MNTEYIELGENNLDFTAISRAGEIIKKGGLVAFPTETVYGLGGDALNPESSKKIYAAKGRPSDNPLIVHICCMEDLEKIVKEIPKEAKILADKYWPGPLTMIFKKNDCVPLETTGGLDTVAVRFPSNIIAREFIRASGGYVAAPSANLSGRPSPTEAKYVLEDMDGRIEMIIDGGASVIGLESTIVDMTVDVPMVLRPGYISGDMVKDTLNKVAYDPAVFGEATQGLKPRAPGMKYRHYAPKGQLTIVSGSMENVTKYMKEALEDNLRQGKRVGIIATKDAGNSYSNATCVFDMGDRNDEETIAHRLYTVLRRCDDENIDVIFSEEFDTPKMGQAIMNRLIKAAGHNIVRV